MALLDLVVGHLDPASQLGEYHQLDIFVLQEYCIIFLVFPFRGYALYHGIGIDDTAGTLVHPLFEEDRILFRFACLVGGNHNLLFPGFDHIHYPVNSFSSCSKDFPLVSGRLRRR